MRCIYCRPEGFATHRDGTELTASEIHALVSHLAKNHGLRKLRLTGGEPTTRPDLIEIIQTVAGIEGIKELAMSTNGLTLVRQAQELKAAGLQRINVSLDSLDARRFEAMTGVDGLPRILDGIEIARAAGLWPIRLNCVVVRGQNHLEIPELVKFAAEKDLEIRFIELMPMGPLHEKWHERYVPESEMREILSGTVDFWQQVPTGSDSARRYRAALSNGKQASVGFITAMSHPFCAECDRIRIGSRGEFYPCLMDEPAGNILAALRPAFDADLLDEMLYAGLNHKAPEHPARGRVVMIELGG